MALHTNQLKQVYTFLFPCKLLSWWDNIVYNYRTHTYDCHLQFCTIDVTKYLAKKLHLYSVLGSIFKWGPHDYHSASIHTHTTHFFRQMCGKCSLNSSCTFYLILKVSIFHSVICDTVLDSILQLTTFKSHIHTRVHTHVTNNEQNERDQNVYPSGIVYFFKKSIDILPEVIFQTEQKYNMYKNLIHTHKRKSRPVMVPSNDYFIFSF